jgi:phage terminase large subunit-like protein
LVLAGRGFGKTRCAMEDAAWFGVSNPDTRIALVASTYADARDTMVEGESGLLSVLPRSSIATWNRSLGELILTNGTRYKLFAATEPDRLRGPQHFRAYCDELAAWQYPETYDQLLFGLRLGKNPKVVIATTPRPTGLLKRIVNDANTVITRGSTFDNADNLAPSALAQLRDRYEGTRLGRQELFAEILDDVPGALWSRGNLDQYRIQPFAVPQLKRVVVAIDPAVTSGEDADETGIICAGIDDKGYGYLLEDVSGRYAPIEWAREAIKLYDRRRGDRIIAEVNNGGEMVINTIRMLDAGIPCRSVHATRGKVLRAEPVSALYEQGKIAHVGAFNKLESQLCSFTTDFDRAKAGYSPDRLDALVWAFTELMIGQQAPTAAFGTFQTMR